MNPSQSGISGVVVGSTVGPEGSVPLSTADELLEVSPVGPDNSRTPTDSSSLTTVRQCLCLTRPSAKCPKPGRNLVRLSRSARLSLNPPMDDAFRA